MADDTETPSPKAAEQAAYQLIKQRARRIGEAVQLLRERQTIDDKLDELYDQIQRDGWTADQLAGFGLTDMATPRRRRRKQTPPASADAPSQPAGAA